MLNPNQTAALRLLGVYTAGRFDFWILAGPAKASCRAHIMSALAGYRVPQSRAGVTALRLAFHAFAQPPQGGCNAERDDSFEAWARAHVAA